ncbi:MAG TPA: ABC transporter substrate-binding protein, partial [Burkholderiales bacterium]|nr:ABC transporter substrate-binding protein [Burkholderiales bacterium]
MIRRLIEFLAASFLALYLGGAPAAEPLKIAFINTLSGAFALQGEETLKNVQTAVDIVNAKGGVFGGRPIEIVPFDNKGNPQETLIVLKQALDQDMRFVISGVSSIAHAITEAVGKHNARNPDRPVLFLDYGALDPALTEAKCSFWHFRFESHADMQVGVLADYMAKQPSVHKVYLINQDYAFGQATSKAAKEMLVAKRADIQIVGDELVPLGKVKDFAPYVAKIRASGADSVLTGNWGNDLSLLIKASNENGLSATYYTLLGAFFGTPGAIGAAGADRVKTLYAYNINAADAAR